MSRTDSFDPFTLEILKDALAGVSDEMFVALQRTSMSPVIYEVLDYACGICDAQGDLVTQGNGVAGFLGVLTSAGRDVLRRRGPGPGGLRPGDVFLGNDPFSGGGTHLSDVGLLMPYFDPTSGELIGFGATKAHWADIGGKDPGSWTTTSDSIFQEGLQLPWVRIYEEGRLVEGIYRILEANSRTPQMALGDLHAQTAALYTGRRRIEELCLRYGAASVRQSMEAIQEHGRRVAEQRIRSLPDGVYRTEDVADDDGRGGPPVHIQVEVRIRDGVLEADFTGSDPEVPGSINCTFSGLESGVRSAFKALVDPEHLACEGMFAPLRIICPPGTVFTARRPAPVSTYWEMTEHATDLIWKALAPVVPGRFPAGTFLSVCGTNLSLRDAATGQWQVMVEPQPGGWGGGAGKDGENALVSVGDGETYVMPTEVLEQRYPVRVEEFGLNVVRAGAGHHRGGRGIRRSLRILADEAYLTATYGRSRFLPWGVDGGRPGSPNYVEVVPASGEPPIRSGKVGPHHLHRGDLVRLVTGSGGGWGDPLQRPRQAVRDDLLNGYITKDEAREDYGLLDLS